MNVRTLREELQRLEHAGLGDFGLYIMPANDVADRSHEPGRGVVISFGAGDYPIEAVNADYGDPEDAGYVFLEFGSLVRPGPPL